MEWLATLFTSLTTFISSLFGTPTVPIQAPAVTQQSTSTVSAQTQTPTTGISWLSITAAPVSATPGFTSYSVRDGKIYWWNNSPYQDPLLIEGADFASFEVLADASSTSEGYLYARDKNAAYSGSTRIKAVDRATWHVLPSSDQNGIASSYSVDALHVFAGADVVNSADPHTFNVFGPLSEYSRDAKHVWIGRFLIENADPGSFVLLTDRFAKDKNHVFSEARQEEAMWMIEGADPKTFIPLAYGVVDDTTGDGPAGIVQVGKDGAHVFENLAMLPDADPATFTLLPTPSGELSIFGKDAHHVYDIEEVDVIEGADPATFSVTAPAQGKDAHRSYDLRTSR